MLETLYFLPIMIPLQDNPHSFLIVCSFVILLGISILYNKSPQELIDLDEYISVPKGSSNDMLYLKLGWQTCINVLYPSNHPRNRNNLYSQTWGWASLNSTEKMRLSVAAVRAQATGELQAIGHDRLHGRQSTIVILNTTRTASARFDLVFLIRKHDV